MKGYNLHTARRTRQWPSDAFACYYHDGLSEEYLYFKLMTKQSIIRIVRAMKEMRLIDHYRLDYHEEEFQQGRVNRKWRVQILQRDELMTPLSDLKRIVTELAEAECYTLHWVSTHRLLNLVV